MREDLLGFLLGALDATERQRIERKLEADPQLREQLEEIRRKLDPLESIRDDEDAWENEPPFGLADRTCDFVSGFQDEAIPRNASFANAGFEANHPARPAASLSPTRITPAAGRHWSWAELAVCAAVFVVSTSLVFPALMQSRFQTQLAACQDNLRILSQSIETYATHAPDGRLPYVPAEGPEAFAGFVAVSLNEAELLPDASTLICPASEFADQVRESANPFRIPTAQDLRRARERQLTQLQRMAGGSFGYTVGYVKNGVHQAVRHDGRSYFPVVSDAPTLNTPDGRPLNHWGRVHQLLYLDGHIQRVADCTAADCANDHPFRNNRGVVEAGLGENDAVIAPSISPPLIFVGR
ncbi:MAG: hypothetical protein KDA71_17270 [Planctomycetales bacterium]|nr:hypothetical protein [Planctomycetales bacterium]